MVSVLVSVLVSIRTVASSLLSNCFELKTLAVDPLWGGLLPKAGALPFPKEDGPDGPDGTGGGLPLPVDAPKAGVSIPKAGALFCPNGCCPNSGFPNETMLHSMSSWSSSSRVLGVSSRSISPPSNKNLKDSKPMVPKYVTVQEIPKIPNLGKWRQTSDLVHWFP